MSNTKTVMGQASNQYVAPLNVEDVFSTYLYEGNGSTQTITNGIDLDGEGGLVWMQVRDVTGGNRLVDSENGNNYLRTHNTSGLTDIGSPAFTLNANGFTVPNGATAWNGSGNDIASWTFRKAPKFFTMVEWSGNSTMGRTISHDLGADVGFILIKAIDKADAWYALHKDSNMLVLNQTTAEYSDATTADYFGDGTNIVRPTSTEFTIGSDAGINGTGYNYIAYLFAHNDGDGGFNGGDIIKCGSYTGNGSADGPVVDLGFEPQFVIIKESSAAGNWWMLDSMRGIASGSADVRLKANTSDAEDTTGDVISLTPTGFKVTTSSSSTNTSGETYIYIAIRRGTKVPESGTEVFAIDTAAGTSPTPPTFVSGFPVDFSFYKNKTDSSNNWNSQNRLTGDADLAFNTTSAEFTNGGTYWEKDYMNGIGSNTGTNSNGYQWMWKRAPGFFDAVAYSGNSTAGRTVSHNLTVAPEMIWVKKRNAERAWKIYHSATGSGKAFEFDTATAASSVAFWNNTDPTESAFTLGSSETVNGTGDTYISYLFASLPGISKVGSYNGNNSSQTIDCGFTSGARFVLIKASSRSGSWAVWDSARGITIGDDPRLELNSTSAEQSQSNIDVEPHSSGFIIDSTSGEFNEAGETYIFYAIA